MGGQAISLGVDSSVKKKETTHTKKKSKLRLK